MPVALLEEDGDPNHTHFAHRAQFLVLLKEFLDLGSDDNDERWTELVKGMGNIVGHFCVKGG